jgi:hypothetical protein
MAEIFVNRPLQGVSRVATYYLADVVLVSEHYKNLKYLDKWYF